VRLSILACLVGVSALAQAGHVRADPALDEVLGGFDDGPSTIEPTEQERSTEGAWSLSGDVYVSASAAYAHDAPDPGAADYRGLTKLRTGAHLELDAEVGPFELHAAGSGFRDLVYPIKKRDEFTHATLETYEADLEPTEVWIRTSPIPQLDIKVGRQIVAWGRSETLRVVDVLNPIDNREPGVVDLADLRLPVGMTRIDYFVGPLTLTGIAIHETRDNKEPVPGSDFFPPGLIVPGVERPGNGGRSTEWAAAVSGRFQGWDASLHWARIFDERPRLDPDTGLFEAARITLLGATGNYALGNWLLKGEVARNAGLRFFGVPRRRFARSDLLLGVEYAGLHDASVAVEVVGRRLHGFEAALERAPDLARRNTLETALRYSANFWNDSVRVTVLGVLFGEWGRDGSACRATVEYEVRSGFTAEIGVIVYEGGDDPLFEAYDENDRILLTLRQSF